MNTITTSGMFPAVLPNRTWNDDPNPGTTIYEHDILDNSGRTVHVTTDLPDAPALAKLTLFWANLDGSPYTVFGTGPGWNGTLPYSTGGTTWSNIRTSGTWVSGF